MSRQSQAWSAPDSGPFGELPPWIASELALCIDPFDVLGIAPSLNRSRPRWAISTGGTMTA